jgi:hypothetical protein
MLHCMLSISSKEKFWDFNFCLVILAKIASFKN